MDLVRLRELIVRVARNVRGRELAAYRWFPPKDAVSLTFEYVPRRAIGPPDEPPQSPELEKVAELFSDITELYWWAIATELRDETTVVRAQEDWAPRVLVVRFGSPFHILVEVPPVVLASGAAAFIGALATVFGAPYKAGAKFHGARAEYWGKRLQADKARREWVESRQQAQRTGAFRLVDAEFPPSAQEADERDRDS